LMIHVYVVQGLDKMRQATELPYKATKLPSPWIKKKKNTATFYHAIA